ncbi:MAG TPA: hypothetical protein PLA94_00650 [Myxococcota bacterium]|nr:hypothetical protein [Myxococcota bacterium]
MRLLKLSGNYAPILHELPLDRALRSCPDSDPWCAIAWADFQLWMPAFTGADPARVPELLTGSPLVGPASARLAWASGDLSRLATQDLDGMGQGLREVGLHPPDPGTWVLSLGLSGAPGAGIGALASFQHPDLGWQQHQLALRAGGDSRGGFSGLFSLRIFTGRALRPLFYAAGGRLVTDRYDAAGERELYVQGTARGGAGLAWTAGPLTATLGGQARGDFFEGSWYLANGPWLSFSLTPRRSLSLTAVAEAGFGSGESFSGSLNLRALPPLWGGTLALRLGFWGVEGPEWREWTAGGAELLRGQPAGRWRGSVFVPAQVEYRHRLVGPLQAAAFVDTVAIDGRWHWSLGGGLRLLLPPEELNVTRVDVGVGEGSWGVVVAWGQAF